MSVIVTLTVGVVGAISALGAPAAKTVHLRGTAYEFNNVHTLLAGATIRVAEFPQLKAVVGTNGRYDLVVPNRARITPYIVDPGYHTVYLQTFTTDGEDLANVNFQTPTDAVYNALVVVLHVPVDAHGNPVTCAIVSTFNTRNVRDLSYDAFIAYGAHGVAGATATAAPTLPKPTYFNQNVFPDPSQTKSSIDGGVVWTNVPTRRLHDHRAQPDDPVRELRGELPARSRRQREPPVGPARARPRQPGRRVRELVAPRHDDDPVVAPRDAPTGARHRHRAVHRRQMPLRDPDLRRGAGDVQRSRRDRRVHVACRSDA